MKQKVRVVGIIKKDDSFLLLKKVLHDDSDAVMWCLPAGKINFGEQPEEAMGRTIFETLNQKIETIKIKTGGGTLWITKIGWRAERLNFD